MAKRLIIIDQDRCVGCMSCMFACTRRFGKGGIASSCLSVHSTGGIRKGFEVTVCRACDNPLCARACPVDALEMRKGGGVKFLSEVCIGCGACREACPFGAVFWNPQEQKPVICIYCGYCPKYCPWEVFVLGEPEEMRE